jgi:hypothetical protein
MSLPPRCLIILSLLVLVPAVIATADGPPPNSIPVIAMNACQNTPCDTCIDMETLCRLSWHYFDGFWVEYWVSGDGFTRMANLCDSTGMFMVCTTSPFLPYQHPVKWWARYDSAELWSDSAFIHPDEDGEEILSVRTAVAMMDSIVADACTLDSLNSNRRAVWYYDTCNEGPIRQYRRRVDGSDSAYAYDDYMPNMYTQALEPDTVEFEGSTYYVTVPVMEEIEPQGVFSWMHYAAYQADSTRPLSVTFSTMHRIGRWADQILPFEDAMDYQDAPTSHDGAMSVRAYLDMEIQYYEGSQPPHPPPQPNPPHILELNAYPFRQVGTTYQDTSGFTSTLGDSLHTWMLDHYSEAIDSTFVTAWKQDFTRLYYHPQAFGRAGGWHMYDTVGTTPPDTVVSWPSYRYRMPTPAEFRMLCGIALLRQAKGIYPYSLRTYEWYFDNGELELRDSGLLDESLLPYDAPYEDWVYTGRSRSDFAVIPPDSIPPWTDIDGNDFDPLYELPSRPDTTGERGRERYLQWKFAAWGRLWSNIRDVLGDVARIGPELYCLQWWDGRQTDAAIALADSTSIPQHYVPPEIRVFTDATESSCYLFYVNRHCRSAALPFQILAVENDFPDNTLTEYLLDHSRRFVVPVSESQGTYSFHDTLEAGSWRLGEFIAPPTSADARVTEPDLYVEPGSAETPPVRELRFTVGDSIMVATAVFNMGTTARDSVMVTLYDLGDPYGSGDEEQIGGDVYLDLPGLSTNGYGCASDTALFLWVPGSDDIGAHLLEARAHKWSGEPDTTDNSTRAVFLIDPRDYATEVRGDAWDMTEATTNSPDWYTDDVDTLLGYGASNTFTDSVGGMFEGRVVDESDNELHLSIPSSQSDWIDGSTYNQLSFAACQRQAESHELDVRVLWTNSQNEDDSVTIEDALKYGYNEISVDLSSEMEGDSLKDLWLKFPWATEATYYPIRIGWVRLTE